MVGRLLGSRLVVDRDACAGHGLCYGAAPEILDCDDHGDPVVTADPVPQELHSAAAHVVDLCPERALTLDDPAPGDRT